MIGLDSCGTPTQRIMSCPSNPRLCLEPEKIHKRLMEEKAAIVGCLIKVSSSSSDMKRESPLRHRTQRGHQSVLARIHRASSKH